MNISKRLPIYIFSFILIITVLSITTILFGKIAGELTAELTKQQLIEKARSQVDMAENIVAYIDKQQDNRIFTLTPPKHRNDFINAIPSSDNEFLHGMKATQIISNMFDEGNHLVNIQVTSQSPINPNNRASEMANQAAIKWSRFSADNAEKEHFEINDGKAYYVRPIYHTSKNCIKCHGDFQSAPVDIKNTFPAYLSNNVNQFAYTPETGFGYRVNDLAGFYEATFDAPTESVWMYLYENYLAEVLFFLLIIGLIIYFIVDKLFASHLRTISDDLNSFSTDSIIKKEKYQVMGYKGELGVLNDAMARISKTVYAQKNKIEKRDELLIVVSNATENIENAMDGLGEKERISLYGKFNANIRQRIMSLIKGL